MKQQQQGGTILGFILGLVVGLGAAFAVAVYVTKVPVPFLNKGAVRGTGQDAAEDEKNKTWDPNAPLYGKNPARPVAPEAAPASSASTATPAASADSKTSAETSAETKAAAKPELKPEAKTTETKPTPPAADTPAASADPLGDLVKSRSQTTSSSAAEESFTYFLQTGAFGNQADAEAQRAKLAIQGLEARISEREQGGRTVFRVRLGPFGKRGDAEQLKERLDGSGVDSALVRVNR